MSKHTGLEETASVETLKNEAHDAFIKWQRNAYTAFDTMAEKLLNELDAVVAAAATNEQLSFAEKLTLLANYVGHGQPLRAFPFLDQNQYRKWLEGIEEPRPEMQAAIIQLCQAEIASAYHEGTSFDRVLSYLPLAEKLPSVVLHGINTELGKLPFDPWLDLSSDKHMDALSVRARNAINHSDIKFLGQLVQYGADDFRRRTPNFGRKSLMEIEELVLFPLRARFGMKHPLLDQFNEELKRKREAGEL